jgi:hypothetical protein
MVGSEILHGADETATDVLLPKVGSHHQTEEPRRAVGSFSFSQGVIGLAEGHRPGRTP